MSKFPKTFADRWFVHLAASALAAVSVACLEIGTGSTGEEDTNKPVRSGTPDEQAEVARELTGLVAALEFGNLDSGAWDLTDLLMFYGGGYKTRPLAEKLAAWRPLASLRPAYGGEETINCSNGGHASLSYDVSESPRRLRYRISIQAEDCEQLFDTYDDGYNPPPPVITSVYAGESTGTYVDGVEPGELAIIAGSNFGSATYGGIYLENDSTGYVAYFYGSDSAIESWTSTQIDLRLPLDTEAGAYLLTVYNNSGSGGCAALAVSGATLDASLLAAVDDCNAMYAVPEEPAVGPTTPDRVYLDGSFDADFEFKVEDGAYGDATLVDGRLAADIVVEERAGETAKSSVTMTALRIDASGDDSEWETVLSGSIVSWSSGRFGDDARSVVFDDFRVAGILTDRALDVGAKAADGMAIDGKFTIGVTDGGATCIETTIVVTTIEPLSRDGLDGMCGERGRLEVNGRVYEFLRGSIVSIDVGDAVVDFSCTEVFDDALDACSAALVPVSDGDMIDGTGPVY